MDGPGLVRWTASGLAVSLLDGRTCWSTSDLAAATTCEYGLLRQVDVTLARMDRGRSYADVGTPNWQQRAPHARLTNLLHPTLTGA